MNSLATSLFCRATGLLLTIISLLTPPLLAQRYNPTGITVAGGNGQGDRADQLNTPYGVYVDASGAVFVVDRGNHRVQKWAAGATSGTTVAGGNGPGNAANQLNFPNGVYVDAAGAVFVSDLNHRVQKWAAGATSGTTVAGGNGQGTTDDKLSNPAGVYVNGAGAVFVADQGNNRVQKWAVGATSGITVAGGNGQGDAANQLNLPFGVYVDATGAVYVTSGDGYRVQKWAAGATSGTTVAGGNGFGDGANQVKNTYGVSVDGAGAVFVSDAGNHRIQKWAAGATSGTTVAGGNGQGNAANQLNLPFGIYLDRTGAIYVADANNNRIQKFVPYVEATATATPTALSAGQTVALSVTAMGGTTGMSGEPYSYTWVAPAGITLSANSTSAVSATVGCGVSGVQTLSVTVGDVNSPFSNTTLTLSLTVTNALAGFGLTSSASTLPCVGSATISLSATPGATNYAFSGPGGLIQSGSSPLLSVTAAGNYAVTATAGSCSVTAQLNITGGGGPVVTLIFGNNVTVMGTGVPTITVPPLSNTLVFQATGGSSYERAIVIDRINGYEIRQSDSNTTGIFSINRLGLFTLTVTGAGGCKRTVQAVVQGQ